MHCFCKKVKTYHCKIILLDEQELIKEIQDNSRGQEVLDTVFTHLNLIETAYFGLRYLDGSNQTHWLDPAKKIVKQLKGTDPFSLYFGVKFYAADPCKLLEEITRYQFFLQVKQDIVQGRLPISFDVAAELGAYVVQSELGDYDPRRHSPGYVSEFRLTSNQSAELESRIEELHKGLIGQLPAAAELSYLEKVKWLEMYGVDLHPVLGEDNVEYFLGLTPSGIIVLRNKNKVGHYYWPRISKIYFKGRYFMIRICDKNNEENTYGFETPSKPACKHLWKCCVEHHAFFRLVQVSPTSPDIFALGSRFRYSGRTEKQAQADAQLRLRSPPHFCRTPSRRYQRRRVEGAPDVSKISELDNRENISPQEMKMVSVPQPVVSVAGIYRSTSSIPAALPSHGRSESPRSTRSAPWSQSGHVRGLYNSTTSPRSVRSAGQIQCGSSHLIHKVTQRSSSVDSQSSNDSRSCKRRHRSRKSSDNESELSKCSNRSHHWQRRRSQSKRDSDSEKDHHHHHHHHHRHRHKSGSSSRRKQSSRYELVDSEAQWKEVQKRQAEGSTGVHQATVISNKDRRSGYMNSGMETESEMSYHRKRKQKKHRSRSRSPSDGGKGRLPDELKKHLEFKLIDTEGMSESQLREIPYKVVETNAGKSHRKYSPNGKRKSNAGNGRKQKRASSEDDNQKVLTSTENHNPRMENHLGESGAISNKTVNVSSGDSGHFSNAGPGSNASTISNSPLADFISKNRNGVLPSGNEPRNSQILPRTSSAIENICTNTPHQKPNASYLSTNKFSLPKKNLDSLNKIQCLHTSALYGNPSTLLGSVNDNQSGRFSNSNKSIASSIKNEADDSGLSVDSQEQTYLKNLRSFKPIQRQSAQMREDSFDAPVVCDYRRRESDSVPDSPPEKPHQYIEFDEDLYTSVNFINNNSITKPYAVSSIRSDGVINQKKIRGPLYIQSRGSSRFPQNRNQVPDRDLDPNMGRRKSASLEFILSPIIKSTYQFD